MWECSGMEVQLNVNCSENKEPRIYVFKRISSTNVVHENIILWSELLDLVVNTALSES